MKTQFIKGHQGDVQFKQISIIPANAKKINNKPLAYGEVSGHVHVLTGEVELFEIEGKIYANIGKDGARLQHVYENMLKEKQLNQTKKLPIADHKSIFLKMGCYEFGIQKRYNPYKQIMEKVID